MRRGSCSPLREVHQTAERTSSELQDVENCRYAEAKNHAEGCVSHVAETRTSIAAFGFNRARPPVWRARLMVRVTFYNITNKESVPSINGEARWMKVATDPKKACMLSKNLYGVKITIG